MRADEIRIQQFEEMGRDRVLSDAESAALERAVRRAERAKGRSTRPWLPKDDQMLRRAVLRRLRVADVAVTLARTEHAVRRRLAKLRKDGKVGYISRENGRGRYPRKSSKAHAGAEQ